MHTPIPSRKLCRQRALRLFLGAALISTLVQVGPAEAQIPGRTCRGLPPTIVGTPFDDEITGTPGDDVIIGLGGDDIIFGYGGNDIICGGPGDDSVNGGDGNDRIYGGKGGDYLDGGSGNDRLFGQRGGDNLSGMNGNDRMRGGAEKDLLAGGLGADYINGGGGRLDVCSIDQKDRAPQRCEDVTKVTYETISVRVFMSGEDPTNSNFGDEFFAGVQVWADDSQGLDATIKTLTGAGAFEMVAPRNGSSLYFGKQFPDGSEFSDVKLRYNGETSIIAHLTCCD